MEKGRTLTNEPEDKKVDDNAQGIREMTKIEYMCQEKKE